MTHPRTKNTILALIVLVTTNEASLGAAYNWPIAESVDVQIINSTSAMYTLHMSTVTIDDPAIDSTTTTRDVLTQHMGTASNMQWGYYHRHNSTDSRDAPSASLQAAGVIPNLNHTFVRFANELALNHGNGTIKVTHNGSPNGNECVGTSL